MKRSASPQRRSLHFDSLHDALADAESLAAGKFQTSGQYSFGQILEHLARAIEIVTGDRPGPKISPPIRWAARLLRSRLIRGPMKPGFRLPRKAQPLFWPEDAIDVQVGLAHLREAIERFQAKDPLDPHPIFGPLSRAEHEQLQCRHCELHLSFVHPLH